MHLKSSGDRPKGECWSSLSPSSSDSTNKANMAAQAVFACHVEVPVDNNSTFSASPLYESKPRL